MTIPLLLLLVAGARPTPPAIGTLVQGAGYRGIIVACSRVTTDSACWEPTPAQVAALERDLLAAVRVHAPNGLRGLSHPLSQYVRQYTGWRNDDGRFIHVVAFHRSTRTVVEGDWLKAAVFVNGGGGLYFQGRYIPNGGVFTFLAANGPK